jgi:hypothetical protein
MATRTPRLRLDEGLLERALVELATCGARHRECVCFFHGPLDEPALIDGLWHPRHNSDRCGYSVEGEWLDWAWRRLARDRRTIRMQLHTHPDHAFHSRTDDRYPLIHSASSPSSYLASAPLPRLSPTPTLPSSRPTARGASSTPAVP